MKGPTAGILKHSWLEDAHSASLTALYHTPGEIAAGQVVLQARQYEQLRSALKQRRVEGI